MSQSKQVDRTVLVFAVLGSLVLINVIGLGLFGRLDLTRDKQFTLSTSTRAFLRELHEPITVRAYFTKDLPPPHSNNARYVRDLLEEYYANANGQLRFEFVDPAAEETSEEKEKKKDVKQDIFGRAIREATSIERDLQQLGIPPVQVRVNEDDKLEVKRAYMGLALLYGDKKEIIPVVSETAGLEYELTTMMRKLVRIKAPKLGIVTGHEGLSAQTDYGRARALLAETYDISNVDLHQPAPADLDALLVVGPKTAFAEDEKRNLDGFISTGHSVGLFLAALKPNLQTLEAEDNTPGLSDLLTGYGININPGMMLDTECATINVTQQMGGMRFAQPVRYPFILVPASLENQTITRNIGQVALPFMSPVEVHAGEGSNLKVDVLARSSALSWIQPPPFNLDPMQRWQPPSVASPSEARPIMVSITGSFKPAYTQSTSSQASDAPEARMLVAGGATFLTDPFFAKPNETLLLNGVDWLVRDDNLLAVRSRGLGAAPLHEISDAGRNTAKYMNIMGLPALFVGFGLVRWRRREGLRNRVTL